MLSHPESIINSYVPKLNINGGGKFIERQVKNYFYNQSEKTLSRENFNRADNSHGSSPALSVFSEIQILSNVLQSHRGSH